MCIPIGGALDTLAMRAANTLVGNPPNTAVLEVAYIGPTLLVETEDVRVSIAGAEAEIMIFPDPSVSNGQCIKCNRSVQLRRGNVISIGKLSGGAVLYVAAEGGFNVPLVLGSASTYIRGGFGGWQGRALVKGDLIPLYPSKATKSSDLYLDGMEFKPPSTIRAVPGPQADYFSEDTIKTFFADTFTVSASSDRMGMRLNGPKISHSNGFDIVSDAIPPGAIQIPGNGQPIVLLADRQTTGGYPKIATVISADLPALGRFTIGSRINFEQISVEEAADARRVHFKRIEELTRMIKPMKYSTDEVMQRLNSSNLIDGVINAVA